MEFKVQPCGIKLIACPVVSVGFEEILMSVCLSADGSKLSDARQAASDSTNLSCCSKAAATCDSYLVAVAVPLTGTADNRIEASKNGRTSSAPPEDYFSFCLIQV